jgi:Tol biopolymer transport system component
MIANDPFERLVSDWLHADAEGRIADHLDAVLRVTSSARQRPAWSSSERWLPMDMTFRPRVFKAPRASQVLLVAAIILALLGALVLYTGSHQPRLPAPFGPAKNGALTFSTAGDIYKLSSIDARPVALIEGETIDGLPSFSRDGRHLWFVRDQRASGGGFSLMVADADGSAIRHLINLEDLPEYADQSPDGSMLAFAGTYEGTHGVYVLKTDGSEAPRRLDLRSNNAGWPMWRPPDGHELLYLVHEPQRLRLYAAKLDGTGRGLVADLGVVSDPTMDQFDPSLSSDGTFMVYAKVDLHGFRNHLVDLDTGIDRQLTLGPGTGHELHGVISPDGTKLLFHFNDGTDAIQEMLAPIDASATAITIGPPYPIVNGSADLNQAFSPDGMSIVIDQGRDKQVRIVDTTTGGLGRDVTWQPDDLPAWQRLAP